MKNAARSLLRDIVQRVAPTVLIAAVVLLFFQDLVLHPTQVLYSDHSDLLAEHIPAKRFLVRSWQETGELPLWCPQSFAGSPFVHDPQVAVFYPPHWALLLLPEEYVGAGLSWLIVLHVMIAGWGTYACARGQGLGGPASLVAACGFMLAGKWMLHLLAAGHYITVGLAWLPWVLLLLEGAIRRRSFWRATAAGAVFGLLVLGTHPQWAFYAGLFLALWTLGTALWSEPRTERSGVSGAAVERRLLRCARARLGPVLCWAGYGAWAAVLALALAAVQLLPTLEAAAHSTRATGVASDEILEGGVRSLLFFVGPALKAKPTCLIWEDRGGFGLLWVVAAALAPLLCRGRVRYQAGVCLVLILFALGGAILFQSLPGFRVFRQPARMLLVVTLPVALLAGSTTQALFTGLAVEARARCRYELVRLAVAATILAGGFAVRLVLQGDPPWPHVYWLTLLVTVPAAFWVLGTDASVLGARAGQLLWGLLLLLDLWALARPLASVRPEAEVYHQSECVALLARARQEGRRVLDRDVPIPGAAATPLGGGAPLALVTGLEPLRGYNPLDNRRYKEYLQFIAGADEPLAPLDGPLTFPVIGNFPIRNKRLLDLLGTGYLLQPADFTASADDCSPDGGEWRPAGRDEAPVGYDFTSAGLRPLPPYAVYENPAAFPRAFVVPEARPLPERSLVLETLAAAEFREQVFLEDWQGEPRPGGAEARNRAAEVVECLPNRVTIRVPPGPAGYLVLADPWYPGWRCTVDGAAAPLYRADFLFRGVELAEGEHTVVFQFEPQSLRLGRGISVAALAVCGLALALRRKRR
jgi:hypothetical protein